jgi:ABC-type transport system involved in multi-copper enzyme maturation permease subunit
MVIVAYLASSFSPRQPQTVALDVGLSGLRFSLVMFAMFWIEQLVARDIGGKGILLTLAYPLPRSRYLVARYIGVMGLLALAAVLIGLMLWIVVFLSGSQYEQAFGLSVGGAYWITIFGFWFDAAIVAAFALMIASLSTVPMLSIALGLAFAIGGKSLGAVLDYFSKGADGDQELMKMAPILDAIQWVLPDLSRLDWRIWPMYGSMPSTELVMWALLMGLAYIAVLLGVAIAVFDRREFV